MDNDTDKDKDTDTDMDTDTNLELELELEYLCKIYIRRYSLYCPIGISSNTSLRKFQRHYKLVAPLYEMNYDIVERGDGSYDNTSLFLYIRQLL